MYDERWMHQMLANALEIGHALHKKLLRGKSAVFFLLLLLGESCSRAWASCQKIRPKSQWCMVFGRMSREGERVESEPPTVVHLPLLVFRFLLLLHLAEIRARNFLDAVSIKSVV